VIEIFCLESHGSYPDITVAMAQKGKVFWHCLVGGASKWKPGQVLEKKMNNTHLFAKYVGKENNQFTIELSWLPAQLSFAEVLHQAGAIPLPPYIRREPDETDRERYQTVYASAEGSVAAPTAGLHFTEKIFRDLDARGIKKEFVTLHVGAGTFKPVKSATMAEHEMHAEWIDVSRSFVDTLANHTHKDIVAVGTTSLRTLESLYWIGLKLHHEHHFYTGNVAPAVTQWEPYDTAINSISAKQALSSLVHWMDQHKMERLVTKTQLLIAPGYPFKIVNGLITNFHQPQSTLLLLVAAFIGDDWKKVYDYALQNDFRFLSYGDGCLLFGGSMEGSQ
jgi:S-adenosylmethionine:tRNA ribosyltransferase-isomerase